jgi:tricorn protease
VRDENGTGPVRKIPLQDYPLLDSDCPVWSPDGKKISYIDIRLNLWYVNLEPKGKNDSPVPIRVDTDTSFILFTMLPAWSPDSRWLAYTKHLKNHFQAVFVHELATATNHQLTDGMSDARYPAFDKNGDYLYFTASTEVGPALAAFEMSSYNRPARRSVYLILLRQGLPSPLAPKSDEEQAESSPSLARRSRGQQDKTVTENPASSAELPPVRIDLQNIGDRIQELPIPARNYTGLVAGKTGTLFLLESELVHGSGFNGEVVHRFDLAARKMEKLVEGISRYWALSNDGEKMLFRQGERWAITGTAQAPKPDEGTLKLDALEVWVDPRAEWRQMFEEAYRIERDFFYDPGHHGLDLKDAKSRYEPYLENLASRADLNYLFAEMYGELSVSHLFVEGGDRPQVKRVPVGLLGADYRIENGRYRVARVFSGDTWKAELRGPLSRPGVRVKAGEYLLAIDGRELTSSDNLYHFFEGKAGKSVPLRVGPQPNGAGSREVTVVPVDSEAGLRQWAWMRENQRKVDEMSGGRVAYVYLTNTTTQGFVDFNRYYFAQADRESPDATAKALFERLQVDHPGAFTAGQLRTLQRRIRDWRHMMARQLVYAGCDGKEADVGPVGAEAKVAAWPRSPPGSRWI